MSSSASACSFRPAEARPPALTRQADIPFLVSAAQLELGADIADAAVVGASMGGWTALMAPSVDPRVRTIVPLCPVGGDGPVAFRGVAALSGYLDFNWISDVSATTIVADRDTWLPLYGQLPLFARIGLRRRDLDAYLLTPGCLAGGGP